MGRGLLGFWARLEKAGDGKSSHSKMLPCQKAFKQESLPFQAGGVFHVSAHAELLCALPINLRQGGCGARLAQH